MDERFTPENIENAANCAQDKSSPYQQDAMDLINEWSQQPDSIISALELIRNTSSFYSSYLYSSLIKNKIPDYWRHLENDQKSEYRNSLSDLIFSVPDITNQITYNLIRGLCYIAVYDWPDDYPNFEDIIFPANDSPTLNISLRILSVFMEEVDTTKIITDIHRNNIRQYMITNEHDKILSIISSFLMEPELSVDVLTICNYMLRWGSTEDIIDFDLFQTISCEFLTNETTCEKAVQCLNSIFISRTDSAIAFRTFSPFLADALAKGVFPDNQPVTTNFHVMFFLLRFLLEYSSIFELVLNYDQAKEDSEMGSLIDENVSLLVETMIEKGISAETLHEDLISLYQVILSIPPDEIYDEIQISYWQLWDNNIRRVCYEQKHELPVKPSSEFFMPFIENVFQSLYMALSSSIDEEGICIFQARTTIGSLYMIDPDSFIEFLNAQDPSPQLCYAIGTIEFVLDQSKYDKILSIAMELMQAASDDSPSEYLVALLYALSHCAKCFQTNEQIFAQFIDFAVNSMNGEEKAVADAATHALQYVVQRRAGLFKGDSRYFTDLLVSQSEAYLLNLSAQSAIRIFKVCTWLICFNKRNTNLPETMRTHTIDGIEFYEFTVNIEPPKEESFDESSSQNLYEKLFEPIVSVLTKPDEVPTELVETSLDIIRECCYASSSSAVCLFDYLWPSLSELATATIPNLAFTDSSLAYVLAAMSSLQMNLPWEQISSQVEEIFSLMQSRGKIEDCFFEYFEVLRGYFNDMDSMYPYLHQEMVIPVMDSDEPIPPSLFLMIGQFSPDVVDVEWLTMAVIQALDDLRTEVGDNALNALQSMTYKLSRENMIKFLNTVAPQLISEIINSIIDLVHKPLFSRSIDFLRYLITSSDLGRSRGIDIQESASSSSTSTDDLQSMLKDVIINSLKNAAQEPSPGFFENFTDYLMSVQRQFFKFKAAFANLLVVLRKASPSDAELFKVEPAQQNTLFSMIFDNFFKNIGNLVPMFEIRPIDIAKVDNKSKIMSRFKKRKNAQKSAFAEEHPQGQDGSTVSITLEE